jgi:hypothetical protein
MIISSGAKHSEKVQFKEHKEAVTLRAILNDASVSFARLTSDLRSPETPNKRARPLVNAQPDS